MLDESGCMSIAKTRLGCERCEHSDHWDGGDWSGVLSWRERAVEEMDKHRLWLHRFLRLGPPASASSELQHAHPRGAPLCGLRDE